MTPIFKYLGYYSTPTNHLSKLIEGTAEKITVGKQEAWFIDAIAFAELLNYGRDLPFGMVQNVYSDCFGIKKEKDTENLHTYEFTDNEILEIIRNVNKKPINKVKVLELLFNGKVEKL